MGINGKQQSPPTFLPSIYTAEACFTILLHLADVDGPGFTRSAGMYIQEAIVRV